MLFRALMLASIAVFSASPLAYADYARVQVNRVGPDLYQTVGAGARYIQTRQCQEYVYGVSATLDYAEFRSSGNRLAFDSGRACEVVSVRGS